MSATKARAPERIHLGEWLKLYEIGPTEAAKIAGCGQSYISNIIANRKPNINALYLLRLSEHIGVSVNDFFRPAPARAQIEQLSAYSPAAQASLLNLKRRKA